MKSDSACGDTDATKVRGRNGVLATFGMSFITNEIASHGRSEGIAGD